MKNKTFILKLFSICIFLWIGSCSKKNTPTTQPCYPDLTPFVITIEITHNGLIFQDSILSKIKMSYYQSGVKKYVSDFKMGKLYVDTSISVVGSFNAFTLSAGITMANTYNADSSVRNFYIEYPNGLSTDTMYAICKRQTCDEIAKSACGCTYPPPLVLMFNNVNAILDTALTLKAGGCINCYANIYLLKK